MGLFEKNYEEENNNFYEDIKHNLKPKDKNIHIILIHTGINNGNKPENLYTTKIDAIINNMQKNGYEIVDVKLEIGGTQGLSYETLITYK